MPKQEQPIGLHIHLVNIGNTLRFALWLEQAPNPTTQPKRHRRDYQSVPIHPGNISHAKRPAWIPDTLTPWRFVVGTPCFWSDQPVPLPGLLSEKTRFSTHNRRPDLNDYKVEGWLIPPELSLHALRSFLRSYRSHHGDGCLAPQSRAVESFLAKLIDFTETREHLPTLSLVQLDTELPARSLIKVPPLSIDELHTLQAILERERFLGIANERGSVPFDEPTPRRFAHFLLELFEANIEKSFASEERATLANALLTGKPSIVEAHRSNASCLYPTHPIFGENLLPQGHLHGSVSKENDGFSMKLGLREDAAFLPLERLLHARSTTVIDHQDKLWLRPGSVLYRDLTLLGEDPLFRRPELLQGSIPLSDEEAKRFLASEPVKGEYYKYKEFIEREKIKSTLKRSYVAFTASVEEKDEVRLRVKWSPTKPKDGEALSSYFFLPLLTLALGDEEIEIAEAEKLLQESSSPVIQMGAMQIPREKLKTTIELAKARQKVIEKLNQQGLNLSEIAALEDQWSQESTLTESLFAEQFERFLEGLRGGAGVPRVAPSSDFIGELRPYQITGLSWLAFLAKSGLGGCLADDMGLGKTVQVLALQSTLTSAAPSLIVCPTSVVFNWAKEAKRFLPKAKVYVHQGASRALNETELKARLTGAQLMITSFALLRLDREFIEPREWPLICVDEAQNLKNPIAQQTRAIKALKSPAKFALTGTPVENRLQDLWSIFDFANPGLLGGLTRFTRSFLTPIRNGDDRALSRLQKRVSPFLLRRRKSDPQIAKDLPEKQEQEVFCLLTKEQSALYHAMSEAALKGILDQQGLRRRAHILAAITRLKQICNHPECFSKDRPNELLERSGKLDRTLEIIEELLDEQQAILIFSQYIETADVLRRAIEERFSISPLLFDGDLSPAERQAVIDEFQSKSGPPILILSLKAGGAGLNLTRATAVIHYDRWWNPAVEDQATDRAHRIGQTQKVNVYKMVTRGTLEEHISRIILEKKFLAEKILSASNEDWLTEMGDEALIEFFTLQVNQEASA